MPYHADAVTTGDITPSMVSKPAPMQPTSFLIPWNEMEPLLLRAGTPSYNEARTRERAQGRPNTWRFPQLAISGRLPGADQQQACRCRGGAKGFKNAGFNSHRGHSAYNGCRGVKPPFPKTPQLLHFSGCRTSPRSTSGSHIVLRYR